MYGRDISAYLREKWTRDYASGVLPLGRMQKKRKDQKDRTVFLRGDGKIDITESCVSCGVEKSITPEFFYHTNNKSASCVSGTENIRNGHGQSCRDCHKKRVKIFDSTPKRYMESALSKFPRLDLSWYQHALAQQNGRCEISNIPMTFERHGEWRCSIQNYGDTKDHFPENCALICLEFNVQEQRAINNLLQAWTECFTEIVAQIEAPTDMTSHVEHIQRWWSNSPTANGVTAQKMHMIGGIRTLNMEYSRQLTKFHLKMILCKMCANMLQGDRHAGISNTPGDEICSEDVYMKLIQQNARCFYTGAPFSFDRDTWRFWSIERLDNGLGHTKENCVLICRLLNTRGQFSRRKVIYALLKQNRVGMKESTRASVHAELQRLSRIHDHDV